MKSLGSIRRSFAPWQDADAEPYISFKNVTKKFGDFVAVDNLNLHIFEREFYSLLGPSGCGKTTLLRMLAGFEQPTAGDIFLDGVSLKGVPPHKRPVNMMFQSYALFPHMSVSDNIAFGLKQLEEFARRKPHQLSGGQRQRVALARSIATRPKLLLLDEPLGALDKKLREETQFELMDLQQELGLTFMIVTHDQEEAMTMSDRIAVMDRGVVVQTGTPAEIYEAPNSRYVAEFIGSINAFEGVVTKSADDKISLAGADGFTMQVDTPAGSSYSNDQQAWFAVRPEKLKISRKKPATKNNAVRGEMWDLGYLGDMTIFHVKLPSGLVVRASMLNAQRTVEDPISIDDDVWLSFAPDAGVLLER